jgi:serine phosphatase RsbU (regulator of sigma subunit)
MNRIFLFLFSVLSLGLSAQNAYYADSLAKLLAAEKNPLKKCKYLLSLSEEWEARDPAVSQKYAKQWQAESKNLAPKDLAEFTIVKCYSNANKNNAKAIKVLLDSINVFVLQSGDELLTARYWGAFGNYLRLNHSETDEDHRKIEETLQRAARTMNKFEVPDELIAVNMLLLVFYANDADDAQKLQSQIKLCTSLAGKLKDPRLKAKYFHQLGRVHMLETSQQSEALNCYITALKNYLVARDSLNIALSKSNIGQIMGETGHEGEKNILEAIGIYKRNPGLHPKVNEYLSSAYSRLATIYLKQNKQAGSLDAFRTALYYNQKGGDEYGRPLLLGNMGIAYARLEMLDSALLLQREALRLRLKFKNREGELFSYGTLAEIFYNQKQYDSSIVYATRSLELADRTKRHYYDNNAYGSLYRSYEKTGNYEKAMYYLNRFHTWTDSINALKKTEEIDQLLFSQKQELSKAEFDKKHALDELEIERKRFLLEQNEQQMLMLEQENDLKAYSLEKAKTSLFQKQMETDYHKKEIDYLNSQKKLKETEAKRKEAAIRQQRTVIYSVSGGGLVLLLLLVLAVRAYRQKQTDNRVIARQKEEVERQKHLVDDKNKEIMDSITYAKRLQDAILPPEHFVKQHLPQSFILYKPKDIVAGDFYWMECVSPEAGAGSSVREADVLSQPLTPNSQLVLLAAADSTGHGVPGAMVSVVCSNALNRAVKEFSLKDPGQILDKTRELVLDTFSKSEGEVKDGMDISLLSIQKTKGEDSKETTAIRWSGANNPLWYVAGNKLTEIGATKQPIGKTERPSPFLTHAVPHEPGSMFYLFTDGFADQFGGPKGKKFKYKQLEELLVTVSPLDMKAQAARLEESFKAWKGTLEQVDDVCIIGIRV